MYSKTKYRRAQPKDLDEKDIVLAGVEFNVILLGSALVPTYNGHGSNTTEVAVDRLYAEKYRPFSFSTKVKVCVQISSEKISVLDTTEREQKETAVFPLETVTFCNNDIKHDRAFALVVCEGITPTYKVYVFHCESAAKAKQMVTACNNAISVKQSLNEVTRVRTSSSPQPYSPTEKHWNPADFFGAEGIQPEKKERRTTFPKGSPPGSLSFRQQQNMTNNSHLNGLVETPAPVETAPNNFCVDQKLRMTFTSQSNVSDPRPMSGPENMYFDSLSEKVLDTNQLLNFSVEDEQEDEFTQLAKNRTTSCTSPVGESTFFGNRAMQQKHLTTTNGNLLQL